MPADFGMPSASGPKTALFEHLGFSATSICKIFNPGEISMKFAMKADERALRLLRYAAPLQNLHHEWFTFAASHLFQYGYVQVLAS
jgi:hypothetical protein